MRIVDVIHAEVRRHVGDRERHDEVVHDVLAEAEAHGREDAARVALEHLDDAVVRLLRRLDLLLRLEEDRRVGDLGADVVADGHDHDREPEADAPAPARNCSSVSVRERVSSTTVASRLPAGTAACGQLAQNPRCLSGECSATRSTAPPHSPPTAKPWKNRRTMSRMGASVADLVERRQAAHEEGRDADQDDRELQQLLAAVLVAEVPEHDAAERAGDEADRVGEERLDDVVERVVARREEDDVEDQGRRGGVEEELVPLDDGAGHRGGDDLAQPARDAGARRVGGCAGRALGRIVDGHWRLPPCSWRRDGGGSRCWRF